MPKIPCTVQSFAHSDASSSCALVFVQSHRTQRREPKNTLSSLLLILGIKRTLIASCESRGYLLR